MKGNTAVKLGLGNGIECKHFHLPFPILATVDLAHGKIFPKAQGGMSGLHDCHAAHMHLNGK